MKIQIEIPEQFVDLIEHAALIWSGPGRIDPKHAVQRFAAASLADNVWMELDEAAKLEHLDEALNAGSETDTIPEDREYRLQKLLIDAQAPAEAEVAAR